MGELINSVCGPLSVDALGRTLMHEHTTILWPGAEQDYRRPAPAASLDTLTARLTRAKAAGISTIVDAAPGDLGRNVAIAREAALRSGVNIVCVTGQYSYYRMPWYDSAAVARAHPTSADDLAANFVHEIEQGIGDSGIRAGLIKVATDAGELNAYEERALRAAARAHRATGAAIITHTQDGTLGREQVAIFADEGADLRRVVIGHNDTGDLAYLLELLDTGVMLGYDRMGYEVFLPERVRMAALVTLLRMGYEDQIVLSHDVVAGSPTTHVELSYVPKVVVPALRAAGVTQTAIDTMMIANPRRIIGGSAAR
jgi:phosphotriesterase-related protein